MKKSYRDLFIWNASVELAARVIELTQQFPVPQRRVLVEQMQRAAVSIPSNIAEGQGRLTMKDHCRFLGMARGSLYELNTQLEVAVRVRLITPQTRDDLARAARQIGAGINRLLRYLNNSTTKQLNNS